MLYKGKSSEIIVAPLGGLCNRMRVIDSAISLSKASNSNLHIIWYMDSTLNCEFKELWNTPPSIKKITQISIETAMGRLKQKLYLSYFSASCDLFLSRNCMESYERHNYKDCNFKEMVTNKRVFITTPHRFYTSNIPFHDFSAVEHLQKIIDSQTKEFNNNVVGVHIRRTDNEKSKKYSSSSKFIKLMEKEIRANQKTVFFVATDSLSEEENLRQIFPNKIITYKKKSLNRNDPHAIQDALVDLYCLSKCRKLIGSYWSSFTDTAYQINGIEHIIAKTD